MPEPDAQAGKTQNQDNVKSDELTPEKRAELGIPEKFKTMTDFTKSYKELEKTLHSKGSELSQVKGQVEEMQNMIADMQSKMTDERKTAGLAPKDPTMDEIAQRLALQNGVDPASIQASMQLISMYDARKKAEEQAKIEEMSKKEYEAKVKSNERIIENQTDALLKEIGVDKYEEAKEFMEQYLSSLDDAADLPKNIIRHAYNAYKAEKEEMEKEKNTREELAQSQRAAVAGETGGTRKVEEGVVDANALAAMSYEERRNYLRKAGAKVG